MHPKSQMLLKVHIFKRRSRRFKEGTSPEFDKKLRKIERTAKALIVAELRQTYPLKYLLNLKDYKRHLNHLLLPKITVLTNGDFTYYLFTLHYSLKRLVDFWKETSDSE